MWDRAELERIGAAAREHGVASYLDGARLLNAAAARGDDPAALAAPFDLVSLALSKGLGCPVGSVLAGTRDDVAALVRYRRMLGGAMRQAGVLAAAGVHALDHHVDRLAEDHANARVIGERLAALDGVDLDLDALETNIVVFHLRDGAPDAAAVVARAAERGVQVMAFGPRTVRAVTHLDVDARGLRDGGGGARGGDRRERAALLRRPRRRSGPGWRTTTRPRPRSGSGYWKKHTGKPSLTWSEAVDEALCFGWIDGVLRRVDDERHVQRFTPRKPASNWSAVNVAKVERRCATAAGCARRARRRSRGAATTAPASTRSSSPSDPELDAASSARGSRPTPAAWAFFQAQPPVLPRARPSWWVISAKKPETRDRRLATLIADSAAGRADQARCGRCGRRADAPAGPAAGALGNASPPLSGRAGVPPHPRPP